MRMKELDLIENQDIREKMIGNVSVLEKVKDLLLLKLLFQDLVMLSPHQLVAIGD